MVRVLHLLGAFPVLYETPILEEMAALQSHGVMNRIAAFHRADAEAPPPVRPLAEATLFLDGPYRVMRRRRRMRRFREILRELAPDLIHAQFGNLALYFLEVLEGSDIPLLVSFRGQDVMLVSRARAAMRRRLFERAEGVLVRCESMRDELVRMGCPAGKVRIIPTGIDLAAFPFHERKAEPGPVEILTAGRLVSKKGMDDAIKAVARCGADCVLTVAGDGPMMGWLQRIARKMKVGDRVRFVGALRRGRLMEEMMRARIFILASKRGPDGDSEGIPNVLKEAAATGLPIVSTRHAGIPECVEEGRSGLLAPEGDVGAIADALQRLMQRPEDWPAMGRRGREIVEERFDLRRTVPRILQVYKESTGRG